MLNILVTGANGQLGREMRRLGMVSPNNYLFTDVAELDITDADGVLQLVKEQRIDVIVNCAAYTNVERAEEDEATAERINCRAAGNLAAAAKECGATLIHVSTDYVWDLALAIFSIIEAGRYAGNEGVYHFSNEGVCSWYDFAVEIAAAAGHDKCRIRPCHTAEFPTKAARPAYSVLDKTKVKDTFQLEIPHWRESMLYCLEKLKHEQACNATS